MNPSRKGHSGGPHPPMNSQPNSISQYGPQSFSGAVKQQRKAKEKGLKCEKRDENPEEGLKEVFFQGRF